jgi:hypothetical protein
LDLVLVMEDDLVMVPVTDCLVMEGLGTTLVMVAMVVVALTATIKMMLWKKCHIRSIKKCSMDSR